MRLGLRRVLLAALVVASLPIAAQRAPDTQPSTDMIARIFSGEFATVFRRRRSGLAAPIVHRGRASEGGAPEVADTNAATGGRRVLITAAQLTPAGTRTPLDVEGLEWSQDEQRVLIFTNTRRVWRTNSRGDYWLLDRRRAVSGNWAVTFPKPA